MARIGHFMGKFWWLLSSESITGCNKKNEPPDQNMIPFLTVFLSNFEIFDRNSQEKVFWYKVGVQNDCQNCKKMW